MAETKQLVSKIDGKWLHDASAFHGMTATTNSYVIQLGDPLSTYSSSITIGLPTNVLKKEDLDALNYKGAIAPLSTTSNTTPAQLLGEASYESRSKGDLYKITGTGYVGTQKVEAGDMIICNTAATAETDKWENWDIIQTNIDPTIYSQLTHTHSVSLAAHNTQNATFAAKGTISTTVVGAASTFTASYTPAGAVSATLSFSTATASVNHSLSVSIGSHSHSFNGSEATISLSYDKADENTGNATASVSGTINQHSFTPSGTISASLTTTSAGASVSHTLSVASHTHGFTGSNSTFTGTYTPAGTISMPSVSLSLTTASQTYVSGVESLTSSSVTYASGATTTTASVVSGTTYSSDTEEITFTTQSAVTGVTLTTNSFNNVTAVNLSTSTFTKVTGVSGSFSETPSFHGTPSTVTVSGTPQGSVNGATASISGGITVSYVKATAVTATFNGETATLTHSHNLSVDEHSHSIGTSAASTSTTYTPSGTITEANGSSATVAGYITVSYSKPSGTVEANFAGTNADITVAGVPQIGSATSTFYGEEISHSHSISAQTLTAAASNN